MSENVVRLAKFERTLNATEVGAARAWARNKDIAVRARGRLPRSVLEGYVASFEPLVPESDPNELVRYQFPLSAGRMAYFRFPVELATSDIARLKRFLDSLLIEDAPNR